MPSSVIVRLAPQRRHDAVVFVAREAVSLENLESIIDELARPCTLTAASPSVAWIARSAVRVGHAVRSAFVRERADHGFEQHEAVGAAERRLAARARGAASGRRRCAPRCRCRRCR